MTSYLAVFANALAPYLFQALAIALGLFAIWAVHKVARKFHLDAALNVDTIVWNAARSAVAYAEEQALKAAKVDPATLPSGAQKLATALDFMKSFVDQRHLDDLGEKKLTQILEAALHVTRPDLTPPASPTPAPSTTN